MTARDSNVANAFETTLTSTLGATDTTANVSSTSGLTSPCYLVIDPDVPAKREYVYFDGSFTATTLVTSTTANRHLAGSAAGSGLTHGAGAVVRCAPVAQHFEDLHDRVDGSVPKTLVDAKGDLLVGTAADTVARKAIGADGSFLKADSGQADGLAWDATPVLKTLVDAKGDLLVGTAADTVARKAIGADDTILMADSGQADGLKWAAAATTTEIADVSATAESAGTSDTWARGDHVHQLPAAIPRGILGGNDTGTSQLNITTETDLTDLSVSVTVAANRRIRITGYGRFIGSTANTGGVLRIKEGTTQLQECGIPRQATVNVGKTAVVTIEPSAGAHTYKLTLTVDSSDGGNIDLIASATGPAFILVEDIGPAAVFS